MSVERCPAEAEVAHSKLISFKRARIVRVTGVDLMVGRLSVDGTYMCLLPMLARHR
jgi:hypothetical protein